MSVEHTHDDCGCCGRRGFIGAMGVAAGTIAFGAAAIGADSAKPEPRKPVTIRAAFIYPPSSKLQGNWWSWPGIDFDAEGRQKQYTAALAPIAKKIGVSLLIDPKPVSTGGQLAAFIKQANDTKPDGLLLIPFQHGHFAHADRIIKETKLPTIIYSCLGVKHGPVTGYLKPGVHLIQSLDNIGAVEFGLRMIQTKRRMAESRILSFIKADEPREGTVPTLGTTVRVIPLTHFVAEYKNTTATAEVKALAAAFRKSSGKVREPNAQAIINAARVHTVLRKIIAAEGADAVMMDCLRSGELMPCMSFMTLRDEGIPAGCENDLAATLTLMLVQQLFDRPGFQHNPAFETEANNYFASHCTCASKLFGTGAPPEPHELRNFAHTNDDTCVPQVFWRPGEAVTMAHYLPGKAPSMLVYSGNVVKSHAMPPVGGCRTNVEITINELDEATGVKGHHNILFYGDYARRLRQYARFTGVKVVV